MQVRVHAPLPISEQRNLRRQTSQLSAIECGLPCIFTGLGAYIEISCCDTMRDLTTAGSVTRVSTYRINVLLTISFALQFPFASAFMKVKSQDGLSDTNYRRATHAKPGGTGQTLCPVPTVGERSVPSADVTLRPRCRLYLGLQPDGPLDATQLTVASTSTADPLSMILMSKYPFFQPQNQPATSLPAAVGASITKNRRDRSIST